VMGRGRVQQLVHVWLSQCHFTTVIYGQASCLCKVGCGGSSTGGIANEVAYCKLP
jgi:hypothetical protein